MVRNGTKRCVYSTNLVGLGTRTVTSQDQMIVQKGDTRRDRPHFSMCIEIDMWSKVLLMPNSQPHTSRSEGVGVALYATALENKVRG